MGFYCFAASGGHTLLTASGGHTSVAILAQAINLFSSSLWARNCPTAGPLALAAQRCPVPRAHHGSRSSRTWTTRGTARIRRRHHIHGAIWTRLTGFSESRACTCSTHPIPYSLSGWSFEVGASLSHLLGSQRTPGQTAKAGPICRRPAQEPTRSRGLLLLHLPQSAHRHRFHPDRALPTAPPNSWARSA